MILFHFLLQSNNVYFLLKNEIKIPEGIGYACAERAKYVALAARSRAEFLISKKKTNMIPIGVGMTGAIITANPDGSPRLLRGGHRADITICIGKIPYDCYKSYHLDMIPGKHTREEEETICGNILKESIYNAFMENYFNEFVKYKSVKYIVYSPKSVKVDKEISKNTIIFPGSFNPVHIGHYNLAKVVEKLVPDHNVLFEISLKLYVSANNKVVAIKKFNVVSFVISRVIGFGHFLPFDQNNLSSTTLSSGNVFNKRLIRLINLS